MTHSDERTVGKPNFVTTVALIALCFLLSSTGWLSWEYHLLTHVPAASADCFTMVIGYLLQALGIAVFAVLSHRVQKSIHVFALVALVLHMVCMVPALMSPYLAGILAFGFLMNVACGFIAGYYLFVLAHLEPHERRASAFGIAY